MRHPIDRGHRRQQAIDRRTRHGSKRSKSDRLPFLYRFHQAGRMTRELSARDDQEVMT
jgi:hypothetical protein